MLKSVVATIVLGTFALGCQATSTDAKAPAAKIASTQAVTCTKCDVTWMKIPQQEKGRVVGYSSRKSMDFPDCKDAVANFFATGNLEHACKTCGPDAIQMC